MVYLCEVCNREFENTRGLGIHRRAKHLANLETPCRFCGEVFTHLPNHVPWCKNNPNREKLRILTQKNSTGRTHTDETKVRISKIALSKAAEGSWHNSFTKDRVKNYNGEKFDGNWELGLAKWFDAHGVVWERNKKRFSYLFESCCRTYTPDFWLPKLEIYVEVKGWAVPKDIAKWKQFPVRLVVLSGAELTMLGIDVGVWKDWRLKYKYPW